MATTNNRPLAAELLAAANVYADAYCVYSAEPSPENEAIMDEADAACVAAYDAWLDSDEEREYEFSGQSLDGGRERGHWHRPSEVERALRRWTAEGDWDRRSVMSVPEISLLLGDWRGVYLPQDFAVEFGDRVEYPDGSSPRADLATLMRGPDGDAYWDAWDDMLNRCKLRLRDGVVYTLHQDGDLWIVPEGAEWPED